MSKHWRWTLVAVVALALWVPWGQADPLDVGARRGNLLNMSAGVDSTGRPVISLICDGEVRYDAFVLDAPDRLVIDLPGVVQRSDTSRLEISDSGVAQVRAAQHTVEPVPVTRVVFDLDQPQTYRVQQFGGVLTVAFDAEDPERLARWADAPRQPSWTSTSLYSERPITDSRSATIDEGAATIPASGATVAEIIAEMEARSADFEAAGVDEPAPEPAIELALATPSDSVADAPPSRAVEGDVIDRLLSAPALAAPQQASTTSVPSAFARQTIVTDQVTYSGKRISLDLVDADIRHVFRLFHEISGLNFVLDPGVSGRVTIVLDQVPWDQALDIILKNNGLDKVLENNVLRIATTQRLAEEAAARKQLKDARELEVEPVTLTRVLSYAKAREVERVIREGGILSPRGRVIVDERTNTLILSDVPKKIEPADALISTLDAETPQVMIEARIVQTSRSFVRDIGVVWGFQAISDASRGTQTNLGFPQNASVRYGLNLPGEGGASALAFSFGNIMDSFTLDVALNALESEGRGRILSSPKIATQNNERAEIEQGVRIPIVNTTATEINVEFVSASLRLNVVPQITAEGTVILDLEVENNEPDFLNRSGDIPSIRTQRAQTKVLVNDGGTAVIGGIFTVNEGNSEVGVPWFRKIPVFGWLFRTQNITNENRELLIFITPKIVKLG